MEASARLRETASDTALAIPAAEPVVLATPNPEFTVVEVNEAMYALATASPIATAAASAAACASPPPVTWEES